MLAATTLGLGDYAVIGGMLAMLGGVTTTLMLANIRALGKRVDVVEHRVGKIENCKAERRDVERVEVSLVALQKSKADRHEFLRENVIARSKMEKVSGQLEKLDAKLDANFTIGAHVGRLVDELAKFREAKPT